MSCKSIKAVLPLVGDGSAPGPARPMVRYGLAGQRPRCWKARSIRSRLTKAWSRRAEARSSGPAFGYLYREWLRVCSFMCEEVIRCQTEQGTRCTLVESLPLVERVAGPMSPSIGCHLAP